MIYITIYYFTGKNQFYDASYQLPMKSPVESNRPEMAMLDSRKPSEEAQ